MSVFILLNGHRTTESKATHGSHAESCSERSAWGERAPASEPGVKSPRHIETPRCHISSLGAFILLCRRTGPEPELFRLDCDGLKRVFNLTDTPGLPTGHMKATVTARQTLLLSSVSEMLQDPAKGGGQLFELEPLDTTRVQSTKTCEGRGVSTPFFLAWPGCTLPLPTATGGGGLHPKLVPQQGVPGALPSPLLPRIKLLVADDNSRDRSGNGQKKPLHAPRTGLK